MHCTNCGHKIDQGVAFCSNCGSSFDKAPDEQDAQPQQNDLTPQQYEQQLYVQKRRITKLIVGISITASLLLVSLILFIPAFIGLQDLTNELVNTTIIDEQVDTIIVDEQVDTTIVDEQVDVIIVEEPISTLTFDDRVNLTNARAMCTAINAYNALYPDDKIDSSYSFDAAKSKAHDLWPVWIENEEDVWNLITVSQDGFATVNPY